MTLTERAKAAYKATGLIPKRGRLFQIVDGKQCGCPLGAILMHELQKPFGYSMDTSDGYSVLDTHLGFSTRPLWHGFDDTNQGNEFEADPTFIEMKALGVELCGVRK